MKLTKKHWLIIGGAAVVIGAGAYALHRRNKAKKEAVKGFKTDKLDAEDASIVDEVNENVSEKKEGVEKPKFEFPIKKGVEGYHVKVLQKYMNSTCRASLETINAYPLELNGKFDEDTEKAAETCSSVKRKEIDEDFFRRVLRDMEAANLLPKTE